MLSNLKSKLRNKKEICAGSWVQVGHPANAEILARAGFSWLALDCEHGEAGEESVADFCRAALQFEATPLVRVRENSPLAIRRALDLGAAGVIVPLINSAKEAQAAVMAARYAPEGIRGFAFQRGNNWGVDFDEYAKVANSKTVVTVMIESKEAVENIDEILSVDGVDGIFIGPYDMSGSYGIPGQTSSEIIKSACNKVAQACERAGKAAGQHIVIPTSENVAAAVKDGFTFIALGMDTVFLTNGATKTLEMLPK